MSDWTVEEAREYLPRLRRLLEVVRVGARTSSRARSNGHGAREEPPVSPDDARSRHPAAGDEADDETERMSAAEALAELEDRGVVLRDLERGLVDFPSRHPNGREVLLCWQLGEPDLAWWHFPEDGFAGRRPLPLPPPL